MTVTEFPKLLEAAPTLRWKVFYALAYTSGARSGELFNLTWADIDFEKGRLYIQDREGTDTMSPFFIKMLKSGKESAFDTEQTLRHKNNQKPDARKEANKVAPSVTPS